MLNKDMIKVLNDNDYYDWSGSRHEVKYDRFRLAHKLGKICSMYMNEKYRDDLKANLDFDLLTIIDDILIDEDGTNQGNRCCLGDSSVYKCIHCEEGEGWNE